MLFENSFVLLFVTAFITVAFTFPLKVKDLTTVKKKKMGGRDYSIIQTFCLVSFDHFTF